MHYVITTFIFFVLLKGLHNDLISITSCEQNYVYTMCKPSITVFLQMYVRSFRSTSKAFFVSNQILLQAIYRFKEISLAFIQFFVQTLLKQSLFTETTLKITVTRLALASLLGSFRVHFCTFGQSYAVNPPKYREYKKQTNKQTNKQIEPILRLGASWPE